MLYILSQVLVVISDIFCIISMLNNKKKNIVLFLIVSCMLFVSHYMCLDAYTGAAIGIIEIVFLLTMYVLELKGKTKYNVLCSVITICLTIVMSVLTWDTWLSALPMLAMIIYLVAMLFANVIIVKLGTFIRLTLNGLYMLLIRSYFGAALSVVILVCTIIGIVKDYKEKNKVEKV